MTRTSIELRCSACGQYWEQAHVCPKQRLASGLTLEEWLAKKHPPAPKGCTTFEDCVRHGCHGECLPSAGEEKTADSGRNGE
jgi:hypothetical protein